MSIVHKFRGLSSFHKTLCFDFPSFRSWQIEGYITWKARSYILKARIAGFIIPQKNLNFPQISPKMPQNGPKMAKNDPKWPKYYPKWPKMALE